MVYEALNGKSDTVGLKIKTTADDLLSLSDVNEYTGASQKNLYRGKVHSEHLEAGKRLKAQESFASDLG